MLMNFEFVSAASPGVGTDDGMKSEYDVIEVSMAQGFGYALGCRYRVPNRVTRDGWINGGKGS